MLPEFIRFGRTPTKLQPVTALHSKKRLPGSTVHAAKDKHAHLEVQHFSHPLFHIGYRIVRFLKRFRWTFKEKHESIRLEAVLVGELPTRSPEGKEIVLKAGQYHLSVHPEVTALFKKDTACHYFVTHYSSQLLKQAGIDELVKPCGARTLTNEMKKLIQSIRLNPFRNKVLTFHHDNCIRELLKQHLINNERPPSGELSEDDLNLIHATDWLLQEDLTQHDDIPTIAERMGINENKLKKGFQKVFKMGVFERLTHHRMEYAKILLVDTLKTIDDIAGLVGYSTRNSFITAFKNNFAITPKQWRIQNKVN